MRNLSNKEVAAVSGGVIPFIVAVVAVDALLIAFTAGMVSGAEAQAAESK